MVQLTIAGRYRITEVAHVTYDYCLSNQRVTRQASKTGAVSVLVSVLKSSVLKAIIGGQHTRASSWEYQIVPPKLMNVFSYGLTQTEKETAMGINRINTRHSYIYLLKIIFLTTWQVKIQCIYFLSGRIYRYRGCPIHRSCLHSHRDNHHKSTRLVYKDPQDTDIPTRYIQLKTRK